MSRENEPSIVGIRSLVKRWRRSVVVCVHCYLESLCILLPCVICLFATVLC